jgi:hypothetical protein
MLVAPPISAWRGTDQQVTAARPVMARPLPERRRAGPDGRDFQNIKNAHRPLRIGAARAAWKTAKNNQAEKEGTW